MRSIRLPEVRGEYRFDYDLSHLTWFKTGGKAEVFFRPLDEEDLANFLEQIEETVPINIIGNCSNMIIRDGGVHGVVIKLGKNFANILYHQGLIYAGAGSLNWAVAKFALQNNLSNLEFLVGIPGTIGGGIKMNAGSYGSEFKDILHSFRAIDLRGKRHEFRNSADLFSYRKCLLPENLIFLEAKFRAVNAPSDHIKIKMDEISDLRANSQPIKEKTSGSTFANPEGHKAWKLIDDAGLRGFRVGGAKFSELHCNFMINEENATSKDLEDLGELAIKKVREKSGIELCWEIKRVGENAKI
ncbi:MAG: UDP-N-acetylmuramate dehydrogenase [Rickettsiaceae bacterium]|nr:UDP-N-acetylmuramate dehydrogenase [Rickettsiaceae bacterium]